MISALSFNITGNGIDTEMQLARDCAEGDSAAFETLYQRYRGRIFRLCLRLLRNVSEAEELTQEIFMQLFRKIGSFQGRSSFATWLTRIAINHTLSYLRARKIKPQDMVEESAAERIEATVSSSRAATPVVDKIALQQAIAQLPERARKVFLLHDVEGYGHEEIGVIMGIDAGTSKSQLHKARIKLRKLLDGQEE